MTRLIPITARELCKKLKKIGFIMIRQKGSHTFWEHEDGRCVVVPIHKGEDIGKGLLKSIVNEIQIDIKEFYDI
jgi:predicted RNA binding protein YcfA (HicA-like mRNA interferase family)